MLAQARSAAKSPFLEMLPPSARADDPVCDQAAALARLDGDRSFLCELAELFVQQAPDQLAAIVAALAVKATDELERLAHSLKGSACHFAAAPTVAAAQWLETAAADRNLAEAGNAYRALTLEVERLLDQLRALPESPVD